MIVLRQIFPRISQLAALCQSNKTEKTLRKHFQISFCIFLKVGIIFDIETDGIKGFCYVEIHCRWHLVCSNYLKQLMTVEKQLSDG